MSQGEENKTEQPTPFRLEEARKKGQVPRSAELGGVLVLLAFCIAMAVAAPRLVRSTADAVTRCLLLSGNAPPAGTSLVRWLGSTFAPVGQALVPVVLATVVMAVVANLIQTGFVFSSDPIKPDFTRMNPAQALKRLFGLRTLWDMAKLALKVGTIGVLAWCAYRGITATVGAIASASPHRLPAWLGTVLGRVAIWMLVILGLLALLDLVFTRREYLRKLRMSRRDIKDEHKQREGDPDIRAKRRRMLSELLKRSRSIGRVPEADVVMTNPTHVAVALRYRPRTMRAPIVLAKGTDRVAERIRNLATRHGVPMLRSPELARALLRECPIDHPVPDTLFTQLAPVYRWLMSRPGNRIRS